MGEDLFVCDCGEPSSNYRGQQCDHCCERWCSYACIEKYHKKKDCSHEKCEAGECEAYDAMVERENKREARKKAKLKKPVRKPK